MSGWEVNSQSKSHLWLFESLLSLWQWQDLVKAQSVKVSMRDHPQSAASSYGRTIPPVIDDVYTAARLEKLALLV